jgi:hypothetical protein
MAMLIAWLTVDKVHAQRDARFAKRFLVIQSAAHRHHVDVWVRLGGERRPLDLRDRQQIGQVLHAGARQEIVRQHVKCRQKRLAMLMQGDCSASPC